MNDNYSNRPSPQRNNPRQNRQSSQAGHNPRQNARRSQAGRNPRAEQPQHARPKPPTWYDQQAEWNRRVRQAQQAQRAQQTRQAQQSQRQQHAQRAAQTQQTRRAVSAYSRQNPYVRPTVRQSTGMDRYTVATSQSRTRRRIALIAVCIVVVLIVVFGIVLFINSLPVTITLNGNNVEITGNKTIAGAMEQEDIDPQPGNLVAVDGSILELGEGELFSATVNDKEVTDESKRLKSGDVVEIGDGKDIMEPYTAVEETIPYDVVTEGNGAIHVMDGTGTDGIKETRTGDISGAVAEAVTQEPSNIASLNMTPHVGNDKVIALTFDDGPLSPYTEDILDVLKENDAKATFFTVGTYVEEFPDLVKRAAREGNQICTHTYDHAAGSGQGTNLAFMSADDQVEEVVKGFEVVESTLGTDITHIMRAPGGNLNTDVIKNIHQYIDADIGWNIDTEDWNTPGTAAIVEQIESAWSGAIVLMHDGGGDRSQTAEALREALPYLKAQGYKFVTIDKLMEYDLEVDNS